MSRRVLPALHEIAIRQGLENINQLGYPIGRLLSWMNPQHMY